MSVPPRLSWLSDNSDSLLPVPLPASGTDLFCPLPPQLLASSAHTVFSAQLILPVTSLLSLELRSSSPSLPSPRPQQLPRPSSPTGLPLSSTSHPAPRREETRLVWRLHSWLPCAVSSCHLLVVSRLMSSSPSVCPSSTLSRTLLQPTGNVCT